MSKRDKLRRKLRNNPKNASLQDMQTLLGHFNFTLKRVAGSHHFFVYEDGETKQILVLPVHKQKVKPEYIKEALQLIDTLFPMEEPAEVSDQEESDE